MVKGKLDHKKIAIIGAGHMGGAMLEGFVRDDAGMAKNIYIADPSGEKIDRLKTHWNVKGTTSNRQAAHDADYIVLAVKPSSVQAVISDLGNELTGKIILSVAAITRVSDIVIYTQNQNSKVVRLMPNIPVAYNNGVIGMYANNEVRSNEKGEIIGLLSRLGKVVEVSREEDIDVLTVVAACGPAIASYFVQILVEYSGKMNLPEKERRLLVFQTIKGTLEYLKKTNTSPAELMTAVATKGGVTEAILSSLDGNNVGEVFLRAFDTGYAKIRR